ncbi:energy-coupling factor transporter transmembrane component T [Clostridiaceae bacterium M8S5]|nr:energy-coupling factor transporter transmembrane component T [Clostridiaceae bacterium M8S5]
MQITTIGFTNKPYFWIDPRSKFILFIAANIAIWGGIDIIPEVLFFGFMTLIFINGKQIPLAIKTSSLYIILLVLDIYVAPLLSGMLGVMFLTITRICRIYMPIILSALFLVRTTTVSEFVSAFNKLRVSNKIIIPFSVMFRFFPTIIEEWNNIQNAMKFRGIKLSIKSVLLKPFQTIEYILVPLLMSSMKIANDLSAASLSRGLDSDGYRTCIKQIKFGLLDYLILVVSIGFVLYSVIY